MVGTKCKISLFICGLISERKNGGKFLSPEKTSDRTSDQTSDQTSEESLSTR